MRIFARSIRFLVVSFAALAGGMAAQVLNMSRDLVTLGIAQQNLTPNNPSLDARPLPNAATVFPTLWNLRVDVDSLIFSSRYL
jgi:hypothetical protein